MEYQKEQNKNIIDEQSAIARLNDDLRCRGRGGRIVLTQGVLAHGQDFAERALVAVRQFDTFDERNDPYQEHDCAIVDVDGQSVLWKIDYYDTAMTMHSPDPADPQATCRVLTVMIADEY